MRCIAPRDLETLNDNIVGAIEVIATFGPEAGSGRSTNLNNTMKNDLHIRSVSELIASMDSGHRPKFLFFWGHTPLSSGSIGKSAFSQWFDAPFVVDEVRYPTAEHFMMAEKARLFGDEDIRSLVLAAPTPNKAKQLGRAVRGFDDARWVAARFDVVVAANLAKFSQNAAMGDFLLSTGNRVIVEASPVDKVWGIGMAADDPDAEVPSRWKGLNLLGFALMEVRDRLSKKREEKQQI